MPTSPRAGRPAIIEEGFRPVNLKDVRPDALAGARRALKPGGRLLYCEHGLAPDAEVAASQARIEPIWKRIAGGCHLCRDIPALVVSAGFAVEGLETMYLPGTPRWAGFNDWGAARPA